MFSGIITLAIVVLSILFLITLFSGWKESIISETRGTYFRKNFFFANSSENAFFKELVQQASPKYYVLAQVNIDKLIYTKRGDRGSRNQIDRKSVDFALLTFDTMTPVLAIELDGHSHDREDRMVRDALVEQAFSQAALPLKRIKVGADFKDEIQKMLAVLK